MNAIGRFSIVLAAGLACLPAVARAQTAAAPRASAARAPEPESLNGLAPGRSGRVAGAVVVADRARDRRRSDPVGRPGAFGDGRHGGDHRCRSPPDA